MSVKSDRKKLLRDANRRMVGAESAIAAHRRKACLVSCVYCRQAKRKGKSFARFIPAILYDLHLRRERIDRIAKKQDAHAGKIS